MWLKMVSETTIQKVESELEPQNQYVKFSLEVLMETIA